MDGSQRRHQPFAGVSALVVAVLPGLAVNVAPGSSLQGNMPADVFWLLSVELQGPQHMLPHLWRMPQWLAWGCYLAAGRARAYRPATSRGAADAPAARPPIGFARALAGGPAAPGRGAGGHPDRTRAAWCAIEGFHLVRVTVFQPFRMATLARGIALVFVAGRLVALWRRGDWLGTPAAVLIAVAFTGDWLLVVVSLAELAVSAAEAIRARLPWCAGWRFVEPLVLLDDARSRAELSGAPRHGVWTHTASGRARVGGWCSRSGRRYFRTQRPSPLAPHGRAAASAGEGVLRSRHSALRPARAPLSQGTESLRLPPRWPWPGSSRWRALLAAAVPLDHAASRHPLVRGLINRCRFAAVPADDIERLGLWCREHTPADGPLHRTARPQDIPALVAAQPGLQPRGQPLPCGRPGRLVRAVSRSRRFPRLARRVCAFLRERPPRLRSPLPGPERRRSGRPGVAPGGDLRGRRGPERPTEDHRCPGRQALSNCCTSRGVTPSTGSIRSCSSSASDNAADA